MVKFVFGVLASVLASVIVSELSGWAPRISRFLLEWAARKLPDDRRDRYYEEWSAHLTTVPAPFSMIIESVRFSIAAVTMRIQFDGKEKALRLAEDSLIRTFDFASSLIFLVLSAPVLTLIAAVIYASDRGPIFTRQLRVGRQGRPFYIYKFRTVRLDVVHRSTSELEPRQYLSTDPHISAVGRLLMKSSLDEIPQLFNVVRGSMSLLGPRPMTPKQFRHYSQRSHHRASIHPGLFSLWQVVRWVNESYNLSDTLDHRFGHRKSFKVYFKILWLVFIAAFRGR